MLSPFTVTICGLSELGEHRKAGVTHVLSILDPGWPDPPDFEFWDKHDRLKLNFDDVIDDGSESGLTPPLIDHVSAVLAFGKSLPKKTPVHLLVHCHAGISRSTAAAILVLAQREPKRSEHEIVAEIVRQRPKAWPNLRMIEMGDDMLLRQGRLIEAVRNRHHAVAAAQPDVAQMMRNAGRAREVDG
jgi:predicted protein tyrosine phosphatase